MYGETGWGPPPARPGPSKRIAPRTSSAPPAGGQHPDVGAEAAAEDRHGAEVGERDVDVAHQHLAGVPAAGRHAGRRRGPTGRAPTPDPATPPGGPGTASGDALAQAVEVQQRAPVAGSQLVQGELDPVVAEPHGRSAHATCSSTSSSTRSGCSMWMKWPAPSSDLEAPGRREVRQHVLGLRPPPERVGLGAEDGEHRHADVGQPHHRPLGSPRAEAAEAQVGVDLPAPAVGVLTGADRDEVAQPRGVEARVHATRRRGQLVDRARLALQRRRARAGGRASR